METNLKANVKDFSVPDFVLVTLGDCFENTLEPYSIGQTRLPLSDLDESTLRELCKNLVLSVYEKADKHPLSCLPLGTQVEDD